MTATAKKKPSVTVLNAKSNCVNCNRKFLQKNLVRTMSEINGEGYACPRCIDEDYFVCSDCDNYYPLSEINDFDSKEWCNECLADTTVECDNCADVLYKSMAIEAGSDLICLQCRENDYFCCNDCGNIVSIDDAYHCDNHDQDYCEECQHDENDEDSDQDGQLVFEEGNSCKLLDNSRYLGVEIEAERKSNFRPLRLPKKFSVHGDGSLINGTEVTTPPAKGSEHISNVKTICKELKDAGYHIENTCGLHVHIDLRDKRDDFLYLSHLLTTFYALEDILYAMQPKSRQYNHYCKWLRDSFDFFDFYGKKYIEDFDYKYYKMNKSRTSKRELDQTKSGHYHQSRYYGVNFHSVFFRGSLEIRIHAGSINPIKIVRWCELIQRIVNWVDTSYNYATVLKLLSMRVNEDKLQELSKMLKFDKPMDTYVKARITQHNNMNMIHKFRYGEVPKTYKKKGGIDENGEMVLSEHEVAERNGAQLWGGF